ncbi:N6-adenosine-methyltransferase subunit [Plakobranchus ocellatus]|uniref:N6-adenosine-methyltransferase subunit n=1 Tax=Plakobranchus ocellatus TaxID=259542 RepID=A0AAV4BNU9_9GAST|nr:N6-adenosine-methyltransferase subunit [Plakobranchus ocellatus]
MADAWNDIQALKDRQSSMRAKMMERRKQREGLAAELTSSGAAPSIVPVTAVPSANANSEPPTTQPISQSQMVLPVSVPAETTMKPSHLTQQEVVPVAIDPDVEKKMLMVLCDISLDIPSDSKVIAEHTSRFMEREVDIKVIEDLLRKFASEKLISIKVNEESSSLIVNSLDLTKLSAVIRGKKRSRDSDDEGEDETSSKHSKTGGGPESGDIESLLSMQSTKEREEKKLNEEIQALLVTQTAKEQYLVEKFKSRGGPQLQEFCQYGTREECNRTGPDAANCKRLHFKKIIRNHTDESLGDCSFLNTCFHMDTCKEPSELCSVQISNTVASPLKQDFCEGAIQPSMSDWIYSYDNQTFTDMRQSILNRPCAPPSSITADASLTSNILLSPCIPSVTQDSMPTMSHCQATLPNNHHHHHPPSIYRPSTACVSGGEGYINTTSYNSGHNIKGGEVGNSHDPQSTALEPGQYTATLPDILNLSDLPGNSSASCTMSMPTFPFSFTAPPPAPAASPVLLHSSTLAPSMSDLGLSNPSLPGRSLSLGSDACMSSAATPSLFPASSAVVPSMKAGASKAGVSTLVKKKKRKKLADNNNRNPQCGGKNKRVRQPDKWKKNVNKRAKVCGEEHVSRTGHMIPAKRVELVDCSLCSFKCCQNFSEDLRQQIFDVFYSLGSNESQKQFVCQNVIEAPTKIVCGGANRSTEQSKPEAGVKEKTTSGNRKLQQQPLNENKRKVTRKYFLPDSDNTKKQVCVKFFCRTLAIGTTFISHALKHKQFGCYMGKERRGKPHNKIPEHLIEPARKHIQMVLFGSGACDGSASKKANKKKFLDQGLNVTKMYEMYRQDCQARGISAVSISMYRALFHSHK